MSQGDSAGTDGKGVGGFKDRVGDKPTKSSQQHRRATAARKQKGDGEVVFMRISVIRSRRGLLVNEDQNAIIIRLEWGTSERMVVHDVLPNPGPRLSFFCASLPLGLIPFSATFFTPDYVVFLSSLLFVAAILAALIAHPVARYCWGSSINS